MQELEKILEEIKEISVDFMDSKICYLDHIEIIIKKHMSGKDSNVPTNDGWIPVERELPESKVLACDKYGEIAIGYITGSALKGYQCESDEYTMYHVIAWRPLPESYRPERSDNHDGE